MNFPGNDLPGPRTHPTRMGTGQGCADLCAATQGCHFWSWCAERTWCKYQCRLKTRRSGPATSTPLVSQVSGSKACGRRS